MELLLNTVGRGNDPGQHDADHPDFVAAQMNRRPRQTLGWLRPAQALGRLLSEASIAAGVATTECIRPPPPSRFEPLFSPITT